MTGTCPESPALWGQSFTLQIRIYLICYVKSDVKVGFASREGTLKGSLQMKNERRHVSPIVFNVSSYHFLLFRTPNSVSSGGGKL